MSVNYREIIKNLKHFIEENFKNAKLDKNFEIDNGIFFKGYIKNTEEKEVEKESIDWLNNMEIYSSENTFSGDKILLARYIGKTTNDPKNGSYIIYLNEDNIYLDMASLKEFVYREYEDNINLGIFLAMFKGNEWYPLINRKINDEFEIENILNIEYSEEIVNHDYSEIRKLFSNMYLFKVEEKNLNLDRSADNSYLKILNKEEFIYKFLGIIKCKDKIEKIISETYFSEKCINEYLKLFEDDIKYLPYENLYLSLCHNSPKFIFLEIYRMIEKLYPIIFTYKFKKEFNLDDRELLEINDIMENKYNIRHKEEESIEVLLEFGRTNHNIERMINNLNQYKKKVDSLNSTLALHRWIYKIRNTSVHLSFSREKNLGVILKQF